MNRTMTQHVVLVLMLGLAKAAAAVTLIPVECVVELIKNDVMQASYAGACSYGKPFVVAPTERKVFRTGLEAGSSPSAPKWLTREVAPGFGAQLHVGHNVSVENPAAHVTVYYSLVQLLEVQDTPTHVPGLGNVVFEMPVSSEVSGAGDAVFRKGEMRVVGGWTEGPDKYQVRIGLR